MRSGGVDFWDVLPVYPTGLGRDGCARRFLHKRGGKVPRWKPLKVDDLGRVILGV